jgi:hypothetical protein
VPRLTIDEAARRAPTPSKKRFKSHLNPRRYNSQQCPTLTQAIQVFTNSGTNATNMGREFAEFRVNKQ